MKAAAAASVAPADSLATALSTSRTPAQDQEDVVGRTPDPFRLGDRGEEAHPMPLAPAVGLLHDALRHDHRVYQNPEAHPGTSTPGPRHATITHRG